jgi:repressor LexA
MLTIQGDYLSGENISDGDYVVIESKDNAEDGDMALIRIDRNNVALRRIFRENGKLILQSTNPKMQTKIVQEKDVDILGVLIAVFRNYLG